ncbi:MAG: CAP domain-containing protein [Patescibacteria group bacterium]
MKKIIGIIVFVVLIASSGAFFFLDKIETSFRDFFSEIKELKSVEIREIVESLARDVFAPPPIRKTGGSTAATLAAEKILEATNRERVSTGIKPIIAEKRLNDAASKKISDMIAKNYFAHVSPDGKGAGEWVGVAGYRYILIGENLAMGNFKDEEDLVTAWMASPGHRANILNPKFKEIGIAVKKGIIEGTSALIAVQIFGLSVSSCPEPDETIKMTIEALDRELKSQKIHIDGLREKMENAKKENDREAYSSLVGEYNIAVERYNKAVESAKSLVEFYNTGVRAFNACALKQ